MQPFDPNQNNSPAPSVPQPPRALQPISSEADILREATQNAAPTPIVSPQPAAQPVPTPPMYSYDSNMATEPLRQPVSPQAITPQASLHPIEVVTPNKRRHGWIAVVAVLVLAGAGLAAYLYVTRDHVTVVDLVNVDLQDTSYLRPKQWKSTPLGVSGFGDLRGTNGKSSQLVGVTVAPNSVGNVTSGQIDSIRPMLLERLNESTVGGAMQNGDRPCTSAINLQKEADTSSTETTIGLYNLTATCQRSDGTFLLKMHGVIGKDGHVRTIGIAAPQGLWKTNQDAYQKMLGSLQQKTPTT